MQTIKVSTTQNVFIQYPIASLGDRILGFVIDRLILIFYTIVLVTLLVKMDVESSWVWLITLGAPWLFYPLVFEILMDGQTPGKRMREIKVIRLDGTSAGIGNYLIRWILGFVDYYVMSGVIAVIAIAAGGKGQRLGDIVGGTSVIKLVAQREVTAEEIFITPKTDYVPKFPEVVNLTERDIELIQRALEANTFQENMQPVLAVTERIKTLLGIQTEMPELEFLYTIVKDFHQINLHHG